MNSTIYELCDSSNPRFNVYWIVKNGKKMWKECFFKREDPNVFKIWWSLDNANRASYINKLKKKGFDCYQICRMLNINNVTLYDYYTTGAYKKLTYHKFMTGGR